MIDFSGWAQEVEDVSTLPEFQNANVTIYVPSYGGSWNVDTNTETGGTPASLIYQGRARVVGIRSSSRDQKNYDPTTLKSVRLQVPRSGISKRVPDQARAYFTDGGRNPQLTQYGFTVNSDFNSSHVAAYTFELTVDIGAADGNRPVFT